MADSTTSWILELIDHITKPIKSITKTVGSLTEDIGDLTESVNMSEKDTKIALTKSKEYYKDLGKSIKEVEKELSDLEKIKKNGSWNEQMKANQAYDEAKAKLERYQKALQGAEADMKDLTDQVDKFGQKAEKWTDLATGINQGLELIQKATDSLDFAVDVEKLTNEVQRMTDLTGESLDEFVSKSRNIAAVYEQDAQDIARAANAMTKQNGGTYQENLRLIEEGYKKGADANGDFLDQLKEYQPFIKQLGLSQSQAIALIAKSGKAGVFSDKAIDSIKEADLSLREMGQGQIDALAGIGLKQSDLEGKTTFDAVKLISQKMKGATTQARQLILADIFKGAGEDAGKQWIEELGGMDLDITKIPSVEQSGAGIRGFFSDIKTWAGQTFGEVAIYAQEFAPMVSVVASGIPIMGKLSKVTWLQNIATTALTGATKILSMTIMGTPIGWIMLAIGALIGVIALCWEHFEGFRKVIFQGWEALKLFGSVIKEYVIDRLNGVLSGLGGIGKALMQFFQGDWKAAWETGAGAADDLLGVSAGVNAAKKFKDGWSGAMGDGLEAHNKNEAERKAEKDAESATPSVNDYMKGDPEVLGKYAPTKKGKGTKEGDGLNVGNGSNGIKSIVMTLNIKNYFTVAKGANTRNIADEIVGHVNDKLRDSVINLGA